MKKIGVRGQRWLKAFHVFFASVWTGAIFGSMTILLAAGNATAAGALHGYYNAAIQIGSAVIPLTSVLTLLTGLLICWLTPWGFFKYWSVVLQGVAWLLVFVIAIVWLDPALETARAISGTEGQAASQNPEFIQTSGLAVKLSIVNAVILTGTIFVAVIKPWGKTRKKKGLTDA